MSFMDAFDDVLGASFAEYLQLSKQMGGLIQQQATMVAAAVQEKRKFLELAANSRKPTDQQLVQRLVAPISKQIEAIQSFREKNRASDVFNHLSAISESIPAFGWILVSPTPAPYVKEMTDASQFYSNKVLMAFKDKCKTNVDWANAWIQFLKDLQKYIRVYHTTGLSWNPKGSEVTSAAISTGAAVSSAGGPPLPPPPPPASLFSAPAKVDSNEDRLALMKELNIGTDITKGLRKVTSDQQTHKNPNLRTQAPVAPVRSNQNGSGVPKPVQQVQRPPKLELEGKKWMIEYQVNKPQLVVAIEDMSQSVNLYKCRDTVVQVKGKVNSVIVDSCVKTAVVFDDVVASVEFINCNNVQAQSMGKVPTLSVEKTDVAQIYLSNDSLNCEIVTAKSSSVNVNVPDPVNGFIEHAIPEQFKSIWAGKTFRTEPTDIAG